MTFKLFGSEELPPISELGVLTQGLGFPLRPVDSFSGGAVRPGVITIPGTTHQLTADEETCVLLFTNVAAISVTAPSDATENLPIGYITHLHQDNVGQITVVADVGVTLLFSDSAKTRVRYSSLSVIKVAANTYKIIGDQEVP